MDRLWTPWRMQYVSSADSTPGCFLCAHAADPNDSAHLVVLRGAAAMALLNLYPYNTAHLLIAPYAHGGDLAALDSVVAAELMTLTQRMVRLIQEEYQPHGFNVGLNLGRVAGAGLPDHLHIHVVPRWGGDTNFMTVVGDAKVMPERLEQTYERLMRRQRQSG